jgi:hypothetical protein
MEAVQYNLCMYLFIICVRGQVLTAVSMKMRVLWDLAPCSLGVDRRFRGAYSVMEAVRTSETSVYSNETTLYIFRKTDLHIYLWSS